MKNTYYLLLPFMLVSCLHAQQRDQLVERAEYYINNDPGKGLGSPITGLNTGFEVPLPPITTPVSSGNVLYVRAFTQNGWSEPVGIPLKGQAYTRNSNLARAEWFLNADDLGEGQATKINIGGGSEEQINERIDALNSRHDVMRVRSVHTGNVYGQPVSLTLSENLIVDAEMAKVKWSISGSRQLEQINWTITGTMYEGLIVDIESEPLNRKTFGAADTVVVRAKGINEIWGGEYQIIIPKSILKYKSPQLNVQNASTDIPKALLTWTSENAGEENGFRIFRTDGTGWNEIASASATQFAYTDEAISNGGSYCWKIQGIDNDTIYNSPFSNEACINNITGVEDISSSMNISLHQNYPNPFSSESTISYSLHSQAVVSLTIHDMLGREVMRLIDAQETAGGLHHVNITASTLNPGMYAYRLTAEGKPLTRAMVVSK